MWERSVKGYFESVVLEDDLIDQIEILFGFILHRFTGFLYCGEEGGVAVKHFVITARLVSSCPAFP